MQTEPAMWFCDISECCYSYIEHNGQSSLYVVLPVTWHLFALDEHKIDFDKVPAFLSNLKIS